MILVTGGAGFIGSHFVLDWLGTVGEPVLNLDKLSYAGSKARLADIAHRADHVFVQGDIADTALVTQLLKRYQPRAVVHFAAQTHVDRSIAQPQDFVQTNVLGTFALLEAVRAWWQAQPAAQQTAFRFLHVSTDEVYGSQTPEQAPVCETHVLAPGNPYAASKAASEHLVQAVHHTWGMPVLIGRSSNNYGPHQHPEKLMPMVLHRALQGQPITLYGDGQHVRDWLHVQDHCAALRAMLAQGLPGGVWNIAAGNPQRNLELARMLCDLLDELAPTPDAKPRRSLIQHGPDRLGHDRRYAVNADRAREQLAWRPHRDFAAGLRDMVRWTVAHSALQSPRACDDLAQAG